MLVVFHFLCNINPIFAKIKPKDFVQWNCGIKYNWSNTIQQSGEVCQCQNNEFIWSVSSCIQKNVHRLTKKLCIMYGLSLSSGIGSKHLKKDHIPLYQACIVEDMGMAWTRGNALSRSLKQTANPCPMTMNPTTGKEIILELVISNIL